MNLAHSTQRCNAPTLRDREPKHTLLAGAIADAMSILPTMRALQFLASTSFCGKMIPKILRKKSIIADNMADVVIELFFKGTTELRQRVRFLRDNSKALVTLTLRYKFLQIDTLN